MPRMRSRTWPSSGGGTPAYWPGASEDSLRSREDERLPPLPPPFLPPFPLPPLPEDDVERSDEDER